MLYYARTSYEGNSFQPLKDHLFNVAFYAKTFGHRNHVAKICELAGYLHDMGKYSDEFQSFIRTAADDAKNNRVSKPSGVDHATFGALYITEQTSQGWLSTTDLKIYQKFVDFMAMILTSHHGGLRDYFTLMGEAPFQDRLISYKKKFLSSSHSTAIADRFFSDSVSFDEYRSLLKDAYEEFVFWNTIFEENPDPYTYPRGRRADFDMHLLIKYVYSCLIDADRLDAYRFTSGVDGEVETSIVPYVEQYLDRLERHLASFQTPTSSSERKIADLRARISKECAIAGSNHTGSYTLTVPTGGGKTLASLRFALEHIKFLRGSDQEKTKIIYVLPYTTIIEQNAAEVRKILHCSENELLEHHSSVVFDDGYSHTNQEENEKQYKLLTERWDVPIIFTTQVQFLNSLFEGGTQSIRRLHSLANSIIIMDEVQSTPLACTYLSNASYNALSLYFNTTILLCTATQPNFAELAVPVCFSTQRELMHNPSDDSILFRRMELIDARKEVGETVEGLSRWIMDLAKNANSILVVMNTKSGVKKLVNSFENAGIQHEVIYLSTNLCSAHRSERIEYIKSKLSTSGKLIVISTNLIECGVDLSFQTVVRNLAGLPSIIQTIGRGNRHGERGNASGYIVDVTEHINSMVELSAGRDCMKRILHAFAKKPEKFNDSLLSLETMMKYFDIYHREMKIEQIMPYPIQTTPWGNQRMVYGFDLLSEGLVELVQKKKMAYSYPFKYMGDVFRVIEENSASIITPYDNEAIKLQGELMSKALILNDRKKALKQIQPYIVNVFENELLKMLKEEIVEKIPGTKNLYRLLDGFYSSQYGIGERGELKIAML